MPGAKRKQHGSTRPKCCFSCFRMRWPKRLNSHACSVNSGRWQKRGDELIGEALFDLFGTSVLPNAAGDVVAVGAAGNDDSGDDSGHVCVFGFDFKLGSWVQIGSDTPGPSASSASGTAVALSAAGVFSAWVTALCLSQRISRRPAPASSLKCKISDTAGQVRFDAGCPLGKCGSWFILCVARACLLENMIFKS